MKSRIVLIVSFLFLFVFVTSVYFFFTSDDDGMEYIEEKGWEAYDRKEYTEAIILFSKLNLDKHNEALLGLADSYFVTGKVEEALPLFLRFYAIIDNHNPNYSLVVNKIGISYADLKDWENARIYFNKAKNAGHPDAAKNLELIEMKRNLEYK